MASELERLLISLDADTRKLRLALAASENGIADFEKKADRRLKNVETRFAAMNSAAAGQLQALGASLAAVFTAGALRQSIIDTTELQRAAQLAGLTTAELQRLHVAASGAGVGAGQLSDAMKELATKVAEVRTRSGGFYEFLRAHLPTVEAQIRGTRSTAEAMDVVAETVRRLSSAEERAAFTKQALGEAGLQLVGTLAKGSAGLREAATEAERYSQVLSADAVKNTVELNREIDALGRTIDTAVKEKIGAAAPFISKFIRGIRDGIAGSGGAWREIMHGLAAKGGGTVKAGNQAGVSFIEGFAASAKKAIESGATIPVQDALKLAVKFPEFDTQIDFSGADAMADLRIRMLQSTGDTFAAISAEYDADLERFRRLLADKKIDHADFEKAREQLSLAAGEKIRSAYEQETQAVRQMADGFSGAMEDSFGEAFSQLLEKGKIDFRAFASSLIADITKVYVQTQLLRPIANMLGGALAGGFGSMGAVGGSVPSIGGWATTFAGAREGGGPVSAGRSYLVGESGPELVTFGRSGMVTPNSALGGNTYNVDARGAELGVEERIRASLIEMERQRESPVSAVARRSRRFPTRRAA